MQLSGTVFAGVKNCQQTRLNAHDFRVGAVHVLGLAPLGLGAQTELDVPQRFSSGQLSVSHGQKLVQAGNGLDLVIEVQIEARLKCQKTNVNL